MKFTMAHSSIAVKDVERSVEFYKKAVGLKVKSVKDLPHINLTSYNKFCKQDIRLVYKAYFSFTTEYYLLNWIS